MNTSDITTIRFNTVVQRTILHMDLSFSQTNCGSSFCLLHFENKGYPSFLLPLLSCFLLPASSFLQLLLSSSFYLLPATSCIQLLSSSNCFLPTGFFIQLLRSPSYFHPAPASFLPLLRSSSCFLPHTAYFFQLLPSSNFLGNALVTFRCHRIVLGMSDALY